MDQPYTSLTVTPAGPDLLEGLDYCQRIMGSILILERIEVVTKKYVCLCDTIPSPTHISVLKQSLMMSLNVEVSQLQKLCHPPVVHVEIGCGDPRCTNPGCCMLGKNT